MGKRVDVEDLIDAAGVAQILGLSHRNSVTTYMNRYSDMPRPVLEFSASRIRLWLRSEIVEWSRRRVRA